MTDLGGVDQRSSLPLPSTKCCVNKPSIRVNNTSLYNNLPHRGNRGGEGQEGPSALPGAGIYRHERSSIDGVHITEFQQSIALPLQRALALCTAQSHTRQHRLFRSPWRAQSSQAHIHSLRPEDENMDTLGLAGQWQSLKVLNRGHTPRLHDKSM